MLVDTRTLEEREHGYPPSPATLIRRCTAPICGRPDEWLFNEVHAEVIAYLSRPGLTVDDLFRDYADASGSFAEPSLHDLGPGRFLRHFGLYEDREAAQDLIDAHPADALDVIRVERIGPDTFYDLWRMCLVRWIRAQGETLLVLTWGNGDPVDELYFAITTAGVSSAVPHYVRTRNGLPLAVDTGALFVLPALGDYEIRCAWPTPLFAEEAISYKSNELVAGTSLARARATPTRAVLRTGVSARILRVFHDEGLDRLAISSTKATQPRNNKDGPYRDATGTECTTPCTGFSYVDQADLENSPVRTLTPHPRRDFATIPDLPAGTYTVSGYGKEAGITVTTTRDVTIGQAQVAEAGMDHTFDLSRLQLPPPRKAFLQGDVVRQSQGSTRWCGPYSLSHAFSYWAPWAFNPTSRNGHWMGDNVHDGWQTWAHIIIAIGTLGIAPTVYSIFEDDPSPGTLQETLVRGCSIFGFSAQPYTYDGVSRDEALGHLKRWLAAGVPVLVAVDEYMDQGDGHWSTEHFKVIVGYDDDARLRYTDDNGVDQENVGAFYFINSGGMGEERDDPTDIAAQYRENHADYDNVPIGNDADAYEIFWKKWEAGSIPTFSKNFWCLPIYPVVWDRIPDAEEP
ncbi:MAG TPA: hypothetical protein VFV59_03930 [Candidatus Limnocylindria bacterium]|nr:hypothetical protein [Candidatus Limnocylindria bacterium]